MALAMRGLNVEPEATLRDRQCCYDGASISCCVDMILLAAAARLLRVLKVSICIFFRFHLWLLLKKRWNETQS
jgi:hypothetical protein